MEPHYLKYPSNHLDPFALCQGHQSDRGRVVLDPDRVLADYSSCSSTRWDSKYAYRGYWGSLEDMDRSSLLEAQPSYFREHHKQIDRPERRIESGLPPT